MVPVLDLTNIEEEDLLHHLHVILLGHLVLLHGRLELLPIIDD